ncbi:MAG: hypothetical protein PHY31_05840, partial [Smithellaceae bacterium]|nr:hypothetical protein [Smithellaceae bacterium]
HAQRRTVVERIIELKKRGFRILNSPGALRAMIDNSWRCHNNILINIQPDGTINSGCYVEQHAEVRCRDCGFTPVIEASRALDLMPGAMVAGWRTFLSGGRPGGALDGSVSATTVRQSILF